MKVFLKIITAVALFISMQTFSQEMEEKKMQKEAMKIELVQSKGKFDKSSLKLKEGNYVFVIKNDNVGKDVGFYLRKKGEEAPVTNSDKAGYIANNKSSMTGTVQLVKGTYIYSCPLNPTKDCIITVE